MPKYQIQYREVRVYESVIEADNEDEAELVFLHDDTPQSYGNNHGEASDAEIYINEIK